MTQQRDDEIRSSPSGSDAQDTGGADAGPDDARLDSLADAVADGAYVDWASHRIECD
jgi:hypothetical protein